MARRSQRYTLDIGADQDFELTTAEWDELRAGGWIESTGYKTARPKRGVVMWIRGADLWIAPVVRVPIATAGWWRLWLFRVSVVAASTIGESWTERRERVSIEREREAENEALLWRTFRRTKGKNEFCWMTTAQKRETLRAFGQPEINQPGAQPG